METVRHVLGISDCLLYCMLPFLPYLVERNVRQRCWSLQHPLKVILECFNVPVGLYACI